MGQTVAVSDAGNVGKQSFAFDWASPEDAANAQKELEAQAAQLLAAQRYDNFQSTAKKETAATQHSTAHKPATRKTASRAKPRAIVCR